MSAVDHKAEALLAMKMAARDVSANFEVNTGEKKADVLALGQLHATLYLAEQQRIANLIAFVASVQRGVTNTMPSETVMRRAEAAGEQVVEGLGLA